MQTRFDGAPVCSLLLTTPSDEVLFAVRDPVANQHFPNAISVPTQRIPAGLAAEILDSGVATATTDTDVFFDLDWKRSWEQSGHDPVVHVVSGLLAGKVGLAHCLEVGDVRYEATLASHCTETAGEPGATGADGEPELVEMVTIKVRVVRGHGLVPPSTASYSRLAWSPSTEFVRAVRERDPLILVSDAHPAEMCVHGVCTYAAARLLEHLPQRAG